MTFEQHMNDETIVRLKIISESHTPEMITGSLGLCSDRSWHVGDKRVRTAIEEKDHGWILGSGLPRTASLGEQVEALLARLAPCRDKIRRLAHDSTVEFSCVIYAKARPALNFSPSEINQVSELGASLDIDLYIME
jgi:hypothetical protein